MPVKAHIAVATARWLPVCFLLALILSAGCTPASRSGASSAESGPADQATVVSTGARRADPGYVQYLERLSMMGSQTELARVVSGSQLAWLRPAAAPFPDPLLSLADTWLSVNPLVTLPETKKTVFASFSSPLYWQIFGKARIGGIYFAPASGSGALWAYNRKASARGDDVIQYTFSETAGSEDDYFRLLQVSNTNRKLLGLELTPATTGLGPDFFLAARYHRQFAGVYCMVEIPKKLWSGLPEVTDQWHGAPLDGAQIAILAAQNLLPPAMAQDFLPTGAKGGWAVTSEIHGVDGLVRRWVYRYYDAPDQPVLNWEDPSMGARKILSGSAVKSVGMLGSALIGMRLDGLYGLDASAPGGPSRFAPSPGADAAIAVSREIRRYGGWGWLKDDIPLSLTLALMPEGPDFFRDNILSPGIEHAMLTGSTTLLETLLDDALVLGLDMRRFVHATPAEQGVSYDLPHLAEVASGNTAASVLSPAAADKLRTETLQEAMSAVFASTLSSPKGNDQPPFQQRHLFTTPAGLAALALGAGNAHSVTESMEPLIRDGHFLQVGLRALMPGLLMISGQDVSGALPLSWYAMADSAEGWDASLASRGAHAYTSSVPDQAVTAQGVPRVRTMYSTPDVQLLEDKSFIARLADLLAIRTTRNIANGTLRGRFESTAPGCFAFAVILPRMGQNTPAGPLPKESGMTLPQTRPGPEDDAVMSASATARKLPAAERMKKQHQQNQQARRTIEQRIVSAPVTGETPPSGDSAIIVVGNFSRETIHQTLNLFADPVLKRIRLQGDPMLLTAGEANVKGSPATMSTGPQTITLTLGPWRFAAVLIGKR